MKREEIDIQHYNHLLDCIIDALKKNGLKSTTMDSLACSLQMSKRTLYEIFVSKETMFKEAVNHYHQKMGTVFKSFFAESSNIMEAILKSFLYHRDLMSNVSVEFVRDINEMVKKEYSNNETARSEHYQNLVLILNKGMMEGYFRKDINLNVNCRMLIIQMESLKRMEELFPDDISLLEVYDNIILSFLRGICTPKGLEQLEKTIATINLNEINKV